MLVLSRKRDQVVEVRFKSGDRLRVLVKDIIGGRVTLGFEGSPDMVIHRAEVWDRIDRGVLPSSQKVEW